MLFEIWYYGGRGELDSGPRPKYSENYPLGNGPGPSL